VCLNRCIYFIVITSLSLHLALVPGLQGDYVVCCSQLPNVNTLIIHFSLSFLIIDWATRRMIQSLNPGREHRLSLLRNRLKRLLCPPVLWLPGLFSSETTALTSHLQLVPRLRMSGALLQFPLYVFVVCRGRTLPSVIVVKAFGSVNTKFRVISTK
jgi:hypothetical protein